MKPAWQAWFRGTFDYQEEARPQLTSQQFAVKLTAFLRNETEDVRVVPQLLANDRALMKALFKRTYYFLQRLRGLQQMRDTLLSDDWKRTKKLLGDNRKKVHGSAEKEITKFRKSLEAYRKPNSPILEGALALLHERVKGMNYDIAQTRRIIEAEEIVVFGELQAPDSQFMLSVEDYLVREAGPLQAGDRDAVIVGCLYTAMYYSRNQSYAKLMHNVRMRLTRAKRSARDDQRPRTPRRKRKDAGIKKRVSVKQ